MIYVESKRKSLKKLLIRYPGAEIVDLTSTSRSEFVKFSPFFPLGGIKVPFSEDVFSWSVEGIWQGLKVFENSDIDISKFEVQNMKNIKRSSRVNGTVLGHRKGVLGSELLTYGSARREIFMKSYAWVLENKLTDLVEKLMQKAFKLDLVLLDYEVNLDIMNLEKPLSHAVLVKEFIDKKHPQIRTSKNHVSGFGDLFGS